MSACLWYPQLAFLLGFKVDDGFNLFFCFGNWELLRKRRTQSRASDYNVPEKAKESVNGEESGEGKMWKQRRFRGATGGYGSYLFDGLFMTKTSNTILMQLIFLFFTLLLFCFVFGVGFLFGF